MVTKTWTSRGLDVRRLAPRIAPDGEPVVRVAIKRDWIIMQSKSGQRWIRPYSKLIERVTTRAVDSMNDLLATKH